MVSDVDRAKGRFEAAITSGGVCNCGFSLNAALCVRGAKPRLGGIGLAD